MKEREMMSNTAFAAMWIIGIIGVVVFVLGTQGLMRWWFS